MTLRAPIYTRIAPRVQPVELLTWTRGLPPGEIAKTLPLRQTDWPNPVLRKPDLSLRTWTNGLPPGVIALTIPQRQSDWPNPTLRKENLELRTWTHTQQIPQPAAVALPFNQYDWPNPQPQKWNLELRTWVDGIPFAYLGITIPQRQTEWPNPVLAKTPSFELKTWTQGLPPGEIARSIPPNQYDWPNPQQKPPNLGLRTWTNSQQIPQPAALPLNQYDWPNPVLRTRIPWAESGAPQALQMSFVTVPNVVTETQAQATTDLQAVGFVVAVSTAYDPAIAAGTVISQDPAAGSLEPLGFTVNIVVSLGPQPVAPVLAETPAGRRRPPRTIYRVTLDGNTFEFKTYDLAVAFLKKAKEAAAEIAQRAIEDAVARQSQSSIELDLPTFELPQITASTRELRAEITLAKREIASIYDRAVRDSEIAMMFELVKRKQEEDEEIFWLF